ncbi:MAG: AAA family ATPase [Phycisphaerae bacterium]|nr:AAA family ATPase [Phycisphaerae bacterium]
MIRSIEIKRFRGIRSGRLDDLPALTVLVGPNGAGKSTVLEAAILGSHPEQQRAVQILKEGVDRRVALARPARWFIWRGADDECAKVCIGLDDGQEVVTEVLVDKQGRLQVKRPPSGDEGTAGRKAVGRAPDGGGSLNGLPNIRFVEAGIAQVSAPIHELYTSVVEQGRREEAVAIVSSVLLGCRGIEILTDQGKPVVHLVFKDHSVPAALTGDGVLMTLRLVLELASCPKGVVLLEEPEVHQHPKAIHQSAKAIWAAVRRGIQVIATTHSLEFIDALIGEGSEDDLGKLAVYRITLDDGVLKSSRLSGQDVKFARTEIEEDLR